MIPTDFLFFAVEGEVLGARALTTCELFASARHTRIIRILGNGRLSDHAATRRVRTQP